MNEEIKEQTQKTCKWTGRDINIMAMEDCNRCALDCDGREVWLRLREKAAALEHTQWAHWTEYMLNMLCLQHPELNTNENVIRWRKQIDTRYEDLTEQEKQSDREWVDKGVNTYITLTKNFYAYHTYAEKKIEDLKNVIVEWQDSEGRLTPPVNVLTSKTVKNRIISIITIGYIKGNSCEIVSNDIIAAIKEEIEK
jgi:hypothetical protein